MNRRDFLRLAGTGAAALVTSRAWPQPTGSSAGDRRPWPRGYLLVQDLRTYHASRFGSISTAAEAEEILAALKGRIDALEFGSTFYDESDLQAHEAVARVGAVHRVDLWMSTYGFAAKVRAFGSVRPEFQAHVMDQNGEIGPAFVPGSGEEGQPLFDVLNPDAVDWFLSQFRAKYLERMKGLLAGLFFNEDCLPYLGKISDHDRRFDYWRNATFSPKVLALWQDYCRARNVVHAGRLVDKFPVHRRGMVSRGGGRTIHVPGWNVPARVHPGDRFVSMPELTGVWKHWTDFTCGLFLENWIGRLAQLAHEVNGSEDRWKGAVYFGLHAWSLPYEEIANPEFRVPKVARWGAWGRQRGIDLRQLAAHPAIDGIVCETYPPIAGNLEDFIAEFERIARGAGKAFGLMLHRDDHWGLEPGEEDLRWRLIEKFQPTILARYPRRLMVPGDAFYNGAAEKVFDARRVRYRNAGGSR